MNMITTNNVEELYKKLVKNYKESDQKILDKAFNLASEGHKDQKRHSGEPYITHPLHVAIYLSELSMDIETIVSAILHDLIEDTDITYKQIKKDFGVEVADIVDGVTKIDRINYNSKEEAKAEAIRKMVVAMSKDIRVLILKLADRLHNIETIEYLKDWKKEKIAQETLYVYAPLAHRLGLQNIKHKLEDVSFEILYKKQNAEIDNLILKIKEGFDVVSGWKKNRKDPLSKRLPSKLFNFITRIFTKVKIHDFNCGLKIYKKSVIKTLDIYGGRHRYIPALAGQKKFKVSEIIVNHRARIHGATKYGGRRFFHGFFDLISVLFLSKYIQSPLYFFGQIGLFAFLLGFGIEGYILYLKYIIGEPFAMHIALLIFGVLLIVIGIQFFSLGLIGEMISNSNQDKETRIKKIYKA